jgi:hypothetical protein
MPKGKKFGGRQMGTPNKRTQALHSKAAAEGQLPVDYLLEVMRDPKASTELRLDAAKAAAPYLHARRAPEDKTGNTVPTVIIECPNGEPE